MRRERALQFCACIGWTALLRCRLSACADGEARPCSGDDDESLRGTRRLLAARFPEPLSASQPDRLCGMVELCARHCHGSATYLSFIARRELIGSAVFIAIGVALISLAP